MMYAAMMVVLGVVGSYGWMHNELNPIVYAKEVEVQPEVQIAVSIDWTPERIDEEIVASALKYSVDADTMRDIIKCESMGSTTIQSMHYKNGVREDSWGLVQIHLPSHPNVTKEQAQEPAFAIDFLAKHMAEGNSWMWTCAK